MHVGLTPSSVFHGRLYRRYESVRNGTWYGFLVRNLIWYGTWYGFRNAFLLVRNVVRNSVRQFVTVRIIRTTYRTRFEPVPKSVSHSVPIDIRTDYPYHVQNTVPNKISYHKSVSRTVPIKVPYLLVPGNEPDVTFILIALNYYFKKYALII